MLSLARQIVHINLIQLREEKKTNKQAKTNIRSITKMQKKKKKIFLGEQGHFAWMCSAQVYQTLNRILAPWNIANKNWFSMRCMAAGLQNLFIASMITKRLGIHCMLCPCVNSFHDNWKKFVKFYFTFSTRKPKSEYWKETEHYGI